MKRILFALLPFIAWIPAQSAVLYDLDDTVLDGGAGENTFIVTNSGTGTTGLVLNSGPTTLIETIGSPGSFTYIVGYFGSASLVAIGDSITLSYTITPSSAGAFNAADSAFRVGLFNSNGTQLTGNSNTGGSAALNNDTGYGGRYRPNGIPGSGNTVVQRSTGNDVLWASGNLTTVTGSPTLVSPGTATFNGSLTLTLVTTGVQITSVVNGGAAQMVIDTSGLITSFDSFSVFAQPGSSSPTLTFSELTVSTVPEPSAVLLLGMAGLGLILGRKRSRSRQMAG